MSKMDETLRMSAPFQVLRYALIHIMAKKKIATQEIADKLKSNRSYVIRLQRMHMGPATPHEAAIVKLAATYEAELRKMGMGFAFNGDIETTLAGGDRSHLSPEQRGGRPRKDAPKRAAKLVKPKAAKAPARKGKPKPAVVKPKAAKAPARKAGKPAAAKPARVKAAKAPKPQVVNTATQADMLATLPEAA